MATTNGDGAANLASLSGIPIAQLNPDLPNQAARAVRGEVTITWPYNSVTKKLAFLIAEPDVRLRRAKGQIRIELQGPSAKAASESGLGAGDELLFSLDGAEWSKDASPGRIPGARVEWQLQFNQKLALQVKFGESGETKYISIDSPTAEQTDDLMAEAPRIATPEPEPTLLENPTTVRKISEFTGNEYPSPAFVKRARLSYGALFEGGFDIFEEDGGVKGRGRKRTRFGRDSSAWRYSSQSPSPERDTPVSDAMDEDQLRDATPGSLPKPQMADEGCQTVEVETETSDASLPRWEKTPVPPETLTPLSRKPSAAPTQKQHTPIREVTPVAHILQEEPGPVVPQQTIDVPSEEPASTIESAPTTEPDRHSPWPPANRGESQGQPSTTVSHPNLPAESNAEAVPNSLFGPRSFTSNFSSFGVGAPAQVESSLSLAEQVRFGFSHIPQTTHSPSPSQPEPVPETGLHQQDPYPMAFLDNAPVLQTHSEMDTYTNAADKEQMAVQGENMPPEPPAIETFGEGQWEMSTQPPHYNSIEGGHFGTDALEEGSRAPAEQLSFHADIPPDMVPEGFASYGHENVPDRHEEQPLQPALPHDNQPLVENEDTISDDEVGVEEEKDEDAEFDEYAYGEQIEEGDYDQRNYDKPSDDEDDLSEEDEEVELETEERYGNDEVYDDEDGEGEEWDEEEEEEEDYESGEEDYEEEDEDDVSRYQPRRPAAPVPSGEPVVISLLSDSEDEDEPVPEPKQPALAPQTAHAPAPPASSEAPFSPKREDTPSVLESVETSDTEEEQVPNPVFGQTDVVDFATRNVNIIQHPKAPLADLAARAETSQPAAQFPGSFGISSARAESYVPQPQLVLSEEGPSDLRFVSLSKSPPAPSETSSEGLFVSQIRSRSPDAEDEPADADSINEPEQPTEVSADGDMDPELEGARAQDESSDMEPEEEEEEEREQKVVEEVEEEEVEEATAQPTKVQNDDTSLPNADDASFSGQVEMPEDVEAVTSPTKRQDDDAGLSDADNMSFSSQGQMPGEDEAATRAAEPQDDDASLPDADNLSFSSQVEEDKAATWATESQDDDTILPDAHDLSFSSQIEMPDEFGESESEYMSVDENAPSNVAVTANVVMAALEVEEVEQVEPIEEVAVSEKGNVFSSEEDVDMVDAGSSQVDSASLKEVASSPLRESLGETAAVASLVVTEVTPEAATSAAADGLLPEAQSSTQQEQQVPSSFLADRELAAAGSLQQMVDDVASSTFGFQTQVDFAVPKVPESSQEPPASSPVDYVVTPPVESQPGTGKGLAPNNEVINGAGGVDASVVETATKAPTSDTLRANTPAEPSSVPPLDGAHDPPVENGRKQLVETEESQKRQETRETRESLETAQQPPPSPRDELEDETMILEQLTQEQQQSFESEAAEYQMRSRSPTPDLSVRLARQAVASKRHKKATEPVRTSPRLTRARSSSLRSNGTNGTPEKEKPKEDPSVSLARAALASPSKRAVEAEAKVETDGPAPTTSTTTTSTATALKADLTKRLRTELPECVPLKSLRTHLDKFPNIIAVVTTSPPTQPARAKRGPREYFMSFHVTDPSAAPNAVVEVHLYRPHKDSLPVVRPGDVVLLQRFQVEAISKKGWGLRTGAESAWAVWEGRGGVGGDVGGVGDGVGIGGIGDGDGEGLVPAPQIKGPPVEDWEGYVGYVRTLREWFGLVMADVAARGKLERADRKLIEAK